MNLAICIPTMGPFDAGTAVDLATLCLTVGVNARTLNLTGASLHQTHQTYLPVARELLAYQAATDAAATHILWLDSDMRFPANALERLLAHDVDIVGANYPRRGPPGGSSALALDGSVLVPKATGLEAVKIVGLGLCLMRTSILPKLSRPWFLTVFENGRFLGEDYFFFRAVREANISVYIDHALSMEVEHVWAETNRLYLQPIPENPIDAIS